MIERDIMIYLQSLPEITNLCNNIFVIQAPKDAKMPYIIIENTGGTRRKLGSDSTEELALFRVTVDVGSGQMTLGRDIAETCLKVIENYRGQFSNTDGAKDVFITCSAVRGWAGIGGAFRYMVDGRARFVEPYRQNP
jgi:hypothetical protein